MAYSTKVIEHYENPRNVGTLDKATRTSARASSARRPAAT
jgi:NifU-like protein involved in Fe-S cluster formation